jgi:STIP1 family protein 1
MNETLASVEQLIEADLEKELAELCTQLDRGQIGQIGFNEDQKALREEVDRKIEHVRNAFCIATAGEVQERVCVQRTWHVKNIILAMVSGTDSVG